MTTWKPARKRCFFMHIPKTAGMTIRAALKSQYPLNETLPAETWEELTPYKDALAQYRLFAGHFRHFFRSVLPPDTYSFTFLRDPARRTLSHLNHLIADPGFGDVHYLARGRDIRSLIEDSQVISRCSNTQVAYLSKPRVPLTEALLRRHLPAENDFVGESDLESALENLSTLSFVGFYESLQTDFARTCDELGLHPPSVLPVRNSARERSQSTDVSEEILGMLRNVNRLDYLLMEKARQTYQVAKATELPREARCLALLKRGVYQVINEPVEFRMTDPLPAIGVWQQEVTNGAAFRWTGPDPNLIFELPLNAELTYRFELAIACPNPVGPLTAFVNGRQTCIELKTLNSRVATIEIPLTPKPDAAITRVELRCARTLRPEPKDVRKLGFVISKAILHPSNPAEAPLPR